MDIFTEFYIQYPVSISKKKVQPSINDKLKAPCGQDNYCNYNSGRRAVFTTSNRSFGALATQLQHLFITLLDPGGIPPLWCFFGNISRTKNVALLKLCDN